MTLEQPVGPAVHALSHRHAMCYPGRMSKYKIDAGRMSNYKTDEGQLERVNETIRAE